MTARIPPPELLEFFEPFYARLIPQAEQIGRRCPGCVVTSWYRDPASNFRAGGVPDSQHLVAFAFDVDHPDRRAYPEIAQLARQLGFQAVVESDHVHVQAFPASTRIVARLRERGFLPSIRFGI